MLDERNQPAAVILPLKEYADWREYLASRKRGGFTLALSDQVSGGLTLPLVVDETGKTTIEAGGTLPSHEPVTDGGQGELATVRDTRGELGSSDDFYSHLDGDFDPGPPDELARLDPPARASHAEVADGEHTEWDEYLESRIRGERTPPPDPAIPGEPVQWIDPGPDPFGLDWGWENEPDEQQQPDVKPHVVDGGKSSTQASEAPAPSRHE